VAGHALVVGGTGMLRAAVVALARDREVSVVARPGRRVEALALEVPRVHAAPADWRDGAAFEAALDAAVAARGPFDLALAWIHSDAAPGAAIAAARRVRGRFLLVLGSASADPSRPEASRRAEFEALPGVSFHEVVLGFVVEGGRSRWLADAEITRGVLDAIARPGPRSVVGVVTPWSARP